MPVAPTYPGVYVEEIPSGVHTIIGVSTSETAFVDFFAQGPMNAATRITSFADFERRFGGLDVRSEASYAIQQYFLNGGQVAWVVRVSTPGMKKATGALTHGTAPPKRSVLGIEAVTPGGWGNSLRARVDDDGLSTTDKATMFNLTVEQVADQGGRERVVARESYRRLSLKVPEANYAPTVVNRASALVRIEDRGLGERPSLEVRTEVDETGQARQREAPQVVRLAGGGDDDDNYDSNDNLIQRDGTIGKNAHGRLAQAILGTAPTLEFPHPGVRALDRIAPFIFSILCLPVVAKLNAETRARIVAAAQAFCRDRRAFYIVDPPFEDPSREARRGPKPADLADPNSPGFVELDGLRHENAALYVPALVVPDPLNENRPLVVGPSGTIAGIYARTDVERGVWKAPAGTAATLVGAGVEHTLTDLETGGLNPLGFNVLRTFPVFGNVCWGARTLDGADQRASEWKYVPVRRTALYIEESLYQGLKWAVFEPNDEPLWAQIRLNVGAFMHTLFRQGAFQGQTRREAYFVKCDRETTTQNDINAGIVYVVVGFAPLKPAEFVIIQIQQMAGQIQT